MRNNAFHEKILPDPDDDDDYIYRFARHQGGWTTLYIAFEAGVYTLLYNYDFHDIYTVKTRFISLLYRKGLIPHNQYECVLFYAGREIVNGETLKSCHIGDEATVNAFLRGEGKQETKSSKRVKGLLDSSDLLNEDVEKSGAKKKRTVRFADDLISCPPSSSQQPFTSRTSSPRSLQHVMKGGLGPGDMPLTDFDDPLVRDCPPGHDLPRKRPLEELSRKTSFASQPLPYDILPLAPRKPVYDSLGQSVVQREDIRRKRYKNANDIIPNQSEYSSSPTAVHLTSNLEPSMLSSLPAVRNTLYIGPSGTKTKSGSSPLAIYGYPSTSYTMTPPPRTHTTSPSTQQAPLFSSFKDPAVSYPPSSLNSPPKSGSPIDKYSSNQPSLSTTPRSILKPPPLSLPTKLQPASTLKSQNTHSSLPSSSQPSKKSALRSLNSYFSSTSLPPPKHIPSQQTLPRTSSNSPQSAKQDPMHFDYFQAARSKATPSESKNHPSKSPLPPLPSPNHITVEPSPLLSPKHPTYTRRSPSVGWSDKLPLTFPSNDWKHPRSESPSSSNSNSETDVRSNAPTRQLSPPQTSALHPPPLKKRRLVYELPVLPLFYNYYPPFPESSFPTPKPIPTPPIPTIPPASSKPTKKSPPKPLTKSPTLKSTNYYSSQYPLPRGSSMKGTVAIPPLAHEIVPEELLVYRAVRQLVENQGWEMSAEHWRAIKRVLEREEEEERKEGTKVNRNRGARGNLEVLVRRLMVEVEESKGGKFGKLRY
ncbi:hypothetical protein MFRU_026g00890 [Monilinia fructicola]|nr:hypothetical protein MFRU_026g00890 [Monilinia fructicola]